MDKKSSVQMGARPAPKTVTFLDRYRRLSDTGPRITTLNIGNEPPNIGNNSLVRLSRDVKTPAPTAVTFLDRFRRLSDTGPRRHSVPILDDDSSHIGHKDPVKLNQKPTARSAVSFMDRLRRLSGAGLKLAKKKALRRMEPVKQPSNNFLHPFMYVDSKQRRNAYAYR